MNELLDTFPAFLAYWDQAHEQDLLSQIERWAAGYLSCWPDLLSLLIDDYASQGLDWRRVASERIFPTLADNFPAMVSAHSYLLEICPRVLSRVRSTLNFTDDVLFVIYVGIGCGGGWATRFQDRPAILFGLENIADCGWSHPEAIEGLVAHELGHIIHHQRRSDAGASRGFGPLWKLYEEGFAQRIECVTTGRWHQSFSHMDHDWLAWCQLNLSRLAKRYLQVASEGGSTRDFFGSWYHVDGRSHTGYFLGHEVIRRFEDEFDLNAIATLDDFEPRTRSVLEKLMCCGVETIRE